MRQLTIRLTAAGVSLASVLAATSAVKVFFDRPGESALKMLPADATMAMSIDLVPGPSQLMAFHKIDAMLKKAGDQDVVAQIFGQICNDPKLGKLIGPYVGKSGAIAIFTHGNMISPGSINGLALVSLTDPEAAIKAFKSGLTLDAKGNYSTPQKWISRISGQYLEVASKPEYFDKLDAVSEGKAKSFTAVSGFAKAKAMLEPEANIKCFSHDSNKWGFVTGSIEDSGLRIVARNMGHGAAQADVKPLSQACLSKIPSGPYALINVAQPSNLLGALTKSAGKYEDSITSAFKGNLVLGVYPSEKSPRAGLDLMILADSEHGAKPATQFKTLLKQLQKQLTNGEPLFGKAKRLAGAKYYTVGGQVGGMLQQFMGSNSKSVSSDRLLKGKTVAYATRGESLYLCTSETMMRKCLLTAAGDSPSVARDTTFGALKDAFVSKSQFAIGLSMDRIIEGVVNSAPRGNQGVKDAASAMQVATHKGSIVLLSSGFDKDGSMHGRFFLPLNYSKLGEMLSKH